MEQKMKFEVVTSASNIKDSMQLDSGTVICTLTKGNDSVEIRVCGDVAVYWHPNSKQNEEPNILRIPSEFPEELKTLISGSYAKIYTEPTSEKLRWELDERVSVSSNNWFEIFLNESISDVIDIAGESDIELLIDCIEYLENNKYNLDKVNNASDWQLKKCIFKTTDEFDEDLKKAAGEEYTVEFHCDGLLFLKGNDTVNTEEIFVRLAEYYNVSTITSVHMDDIDEIGVWICYKN